LLQAAAVLLQAAVVLAVYFKVPTMPSHQVLM
jgi:hypothetical protein